MKNMYLILAVIAFTMPSVLAKTDWRTFTNKAGKTFQGEVIKVDLERNETTIKSKKNRKSFTLKFNTLIESDIEYLKNWKPSVIAPPEEKPSKDKADLGKAEKRFYSRTKEDIAEKIKEIMDRKPSSGIEDIQQEALNTLNVYRYLSGVSDKVKLDRSMISDASRAAEACKAHGKLSHDIGSSTDTCNLSANGNIVKSVKEYIDDFGANNRDKRGHRLCCLNPGMTKTGFGSAGAKYSAMWSLDGYLKSASSERAYPGSGFFPLKYLHGTGWTIYLKDHAPGARSLKVEVFKLEKRPKKTFGMTAEIPGTVVPVNFVATHENAINFEPETTIVHKGGIFWIRIRGDGVRESYLVELY